MERLDLGERQFPQADVLKILPRLSAKSLQNWRNRGIIDIDKAGQGKGKAHLYTGHGIIMLAFMERLVDLGIPPADAVKMAPGVAQCAQQIWDLRLDEVRPSGMRQIIPPASSTNDDYRRSFIFKDDIGYRMEIGRKDRTGSFTTRFYIVFAVDLFNINVLNLINRHLAGLHPVVVHIHDNFDEEGEEVERRHELILSKIRMLPVDKWDEHA